MGRNLGKPVGDDLQALMAHYGIAPDEQGALAKLAERVQRPAGTVANWHKRGRVPEEYMLRIKLEERTRGQVGSVHLGRRHIELEQSDTLSHFPPRTGEPAAPRVNPYRVTVLEGDPEGRGAGSIHPRSAGEPRPLVLRLDLSPGHEVEFQVIPTVEGVAQAGPADMAPSHAETVIDIGGEMAFTADWLRRHLGEHGALASVRVSGDSMAPTVFDGETIIIDRSESVIGVSGVYVIALRGKRHVKRMQVRLDGSVVVMSDNQAYASETVPAERAHELQVIGRMVWPRVR